MPIDCLILPLSTDGSVTRQTSAWLSTSIPALYGCPIATPSVVKKSLSACKQKLSASRLSRPTGTSHKGEQEVVVLRVVIERRGERERFPLRRDQRLVGRAAVVQPEARELRRVDVLHKLLVLGRRDAAVQHPPGRGGVVGRVELGSRDVRRARDVDQICRPMG